jgi:carbamoyl-phosphate synthase large subunit
LNILVTSVGIRGYLIKYFRKALKNKGKIFAADCSKYAPALYDADYYFILPSISEKNYIDELLKICLVNNIKAIVSLNDKELPILAQSKNKFINKGIKLIISNPRVIDICYDKYSTYKFLKENKFPFPKTFISIDEALKEIKAKTLKFPLLIKPRKGSASLGIKKVFNKKDLQNKFKEEENLFIQEFLQGDEYGIDVFCNSNLLPVSIFVKRKIKMRAGETDKAITVYDIKMIGFINNLIKKLGIYGPGDIDLFKRGNEYIVMEINPRFGGGYPMSHAVGAEFPEKIIKLISEEPLQPDLIRYPNNVVMMKQYGIVIKKFNKL